jgi:hypothetical protein
MRIADANVFSGFARKTAEQASDFAGVVRNLILDVRDSYRPGVHEMRGPGRHRMSPVHVRRRDAAHPIG